MEIRVLRYFLAVAREGNITAAANFLHLTQPTLSRQIKDLEEELGVQLLIRKSHNVSLTDDGMRLRKRAEEIVSMVDKISAEFISAKNTVTGDIYIGGAEKQEQCMRVQKSSKNSATFIPVYTFTCTAETQQT